MVNFDALWTPLKVISWATHFLMEKGVVEPRLDVEDVMIHTLHLDRLKIYVQFDHPLKNWELALIRNHLIRLSKREPFQYVVGFKIFCGFQFKVSSDVLIPRPETEHLIEKAVQFLKGIPFEKRKVLDLGTGSGCVPISVRLNVPCKVWSVDVSQRALKVARENASFHSISGDFVWRLGAWFSALEKIDPQQFSLITCNPPYLADWERKELMPEVSEYEPLVALFSGRVGLESYEDLRKSLWEHLCWGGRAYFELHENRHGNIQTIFADLPWKRYELTPDHRGRPRVLMLEK